ncbi:MFS transporter [Luteococcus japonicus]|uniref:Nitrate/nitrite transporter n=1 Tax=Luteococcus japonicus LSP_Lj1 TaxID=1255658 RepID=A0A1R4KHT6_9ACTN|nr:MFS transporter [Luteococcus japonicus]SJN43654.1 Nitrate/nitrite transporter [Luteococcus japonicus LSP_Lj1]
MSTAPTHPEPPLKGQLGQVILATLASCTGFWAWMSIAPMQKTYAQSMGLKEGQIAMMLATPVIVGSLGRILVGALTDRLGGRKMFTAILLLSAPAVVLVSIAGQTKNYPLLIGAGFYLGIAGTIFAVGIPFSSAWYAAERRGFANGVFGMGMIGTAVAAFATPRLVKALGYSTAHCAIAAFLVAMAAVVWFAMKESPAWEPQVNPIVPRITAALKLGITWQMCFLYAIVFGGFVAFSTFLPKYLTTVYPHLDTVAAANRMGSFVIAAVLARPFGGILADKVGPKIISLISLAGVAAMAFIASTQPKEGALTGITFLLMAACLGLGQGSIFGWVPRVSPKDKVGAISGTVAAAGGLGGYFPPLVMAATYDAATNSYAKGLWALVTTSVLGIVLAAVLKEKREA